MAIKKVEEVAESVYLILDKPITATCSSASICRCLPILPFVCECIFVCFCIYELMVCTRYLPPFLRLILAETGGLLTHARDTCAILSLCVQVFAPCSSGWRSGQGRGGRGGSVLRRRARRARGRRLGGWTVRAIKRLRRKG